MFPGIDPFSPPLPAPFQGVEADERALIPLIPECLTKGARLKSPPSGQSGASIILSALTEARRSLQTLLRTVKRSHFTLPALDDAILLYSLHLTYPLSKSTSQTRDRLIQFMHELILSRWL